MLISKKTHCFTCNGAMVRQELKDPYINKLYYVKYKCEDCPSWSKTALRGLQRGLTKFYDGASTWMIGDK